MTPTEQRRAPTTAESLQEYGRGIGGGFLFSLPLFLTMETWSAAVTMAPGRLVMAVLATFVLLCGYNLYAVRNPNKLARLDGAAALTRT